jgi:hypothetical protein
VEGHVPAAALKRFLAEKPTATGLAVPGMPIGSPGVRGALPNHMKWFCLGPLAVALTCGSLEKRLLVEAERGLLLPGQMGLQRSLRGFEE